MSAYDSKWIIYQSGSIAEHFRQNILIFLACIHIDNRYNINSKAFVKGIMEECTQSVLSISVDQS